MDIISNEKIIKYKNNEFEAFTDKVATEFPLTIYINDTEFATLVCTPDHLEELVIGFLASEGVIRSFSDIKSMNIDDRGGFCHIETTREIPIDVFSFTKRVLGSCCGKSRQFYFQSDMEMSKVSMSKTKITPDQIISLMKTMQDTSDVFKETGGIHNASIATPNGIIVQRGDIGRHNALDKLYGYCLKNNITVHDKVIIFSGRMSSEVLTKVSKIGVGIVLSKSAPTDLALRLAEDLNITAVGFIRRGMFNIYSHSDRVVGANKEE
ncbi:formate dehydrogenase accessory sulfurtransferase FdhD [Nosocomiicoccus ampullae]|uniref:Sulfur carrier protein FdhD n=1 Tax=Nosocomiicoccus ampullae TaxID=489910 RepID=A0A9Q2CZ21_9STAP|nr:formate dehydrogenase accessory sulfurtransferase FdhD [Nosocomiicoccus ampullae]MBB5175547.1 FdhD protein [Nosocomiicoccus ampullae]QYA46952.1 formate dehydrogenase accessory sulfurtransferase FdhD [Nosocomiicoccus ampullae]